MGSADVVTDIIEFVIALENQPAPLSEAASAAIKSVIASVLTRVGTPATPWADYPTGLSQISKFFKLAAEVTGDQVASVFAAGLAALNELNVTNGRSVPGLVCRVYLQLVLLPC